MNLKHKRQLFNKPKSIVTGDKVVVLAGDHKGKAGTVLRTILVNGQYRVILGGVGEHNVYRRFQRNTNARKLISLQRSIHISNVSLLDESLDKPTRTFVSIVDGKKIRTSCKSKQTIAKMVKSEVVQLRKDRIQKLREQYMTPATSPNSENKDNAQIGGFYAPVDNEISHPIVSSDLSESKENNHE